MVVVVVGRGWGGGGGGDTSLCMGYRDVWPCSG